MEKFRSLQVCLLSLIVTLIGCSEQSGQFSEVRDALPGATAAAEHEFNTEAYDDVVENSFLNAKSNPLSTFSIDVDTASYANVRRMLNEDQLPPAGAVRVEEFINYFAYDYPQPEADSDPFSVSVEVADCPWAEGHQLARIGLKGRQFEQDEQPPCNLVFLMDVSGSMNDWNKLPLVKSALRMLVEELDEQDRVAIVVYAGATGLALPSLPGDQRAAIMTAVDNLNAGGSTNGGAGIQLAYGIAQENFIEGGSNRVILCTDGDFNVGTTNQSDLVELISQKAESGVFLSVLGFGTGNYKDSTMEKLADKGNGNYGYIDSLKEAQKLLVEQVAGTLITIAKDVKIQVDFNPANVQAYRLLGYENRLLQAEDFQDDEKDAGEIGAGHTVTALYEFVPAGSDSPAGKVEPSKYQADAELSAQAMSDELLTVRLRYKLPDAKTSEPFEVPVQQADRQFADASADFQFASAVAAFGMLLRNSEHARNATYDSVLEIATQNLNGDPHGFRGEFITLVEKARSLHSQE